MIIYGRNLSPFTRRVVVWARLQGHAVERRELAPAQPADFEALCRVNPAGRVPAVMLDDGSCLFESWAICDWLETEAAPEQRLLPTEPGARRVATQQLGLANTIAEKAVARVYESRRPEAVQWSDWAARLERQAAGALDLLEAQTPESGFFGGARVNGVDVGAVCAVDFLSATNPSLLEGRAARLQALAAQANTAPVFSETKP